LLAIYSVYEVSKRIIKDIIVKLGKLQLL